MKAKSKFKKEFRRQLRLAIAAAIGFIIAFSWKDTIIRFVNSSVEKFSELTSTYLVNITSSIIITIIGVFIIIMTSKMLKN